MENNCGISGFRDFEEACWTLRDCLLQRTQMTPDVVRLEDALHRLGDAIGMLEGILGAGEGGLSKG